jgi:hypothetical protein
VELEFCDDTSDDDIQQAFFDYGYEKAQSQIDIGVEILCIHHEEDDEDEE